MNKIAESQLKKQKQTIDNLNNALASIEFYKKQIEESLNIVLMFKVGDDTTGELSAKDSNFLDQANRLGADFSNEEEHNGTTTLSILYPLEDLNSQYRA